MRRTRFAIHISPCKKALKFARLVETHIQLHFPNTRHSCNRSYPIPYRAKFRYKTLFITIINNDQNYIIFGIIFIAKTPAIHWWYLYGDLILIIEIPIFITEWPIAVLVFMSLGTRTSEARGARASTREPFTVIKKGRPFHLSVISGLRQSKSPNIVGNQILISLNG